MTDVKCKAFMAQKHCDARVARTWMATSYNKRL